VSASFDNSRDEFAPRGAAIVGGLLDEAGIAAAAAVEPPTRAPTLF
jgi:hypothetical protein